MRTSAILGFSGYQAPQQAPAFRMTRPRADILLDVELGMAWAAGDLSIFPP